MFLMSSTSTEKWNEYLVAQYHEAFPPLPLLENGKWDQQRSKAVGKSKHYLEQVGESLEVIKWLKLFTKSAKKKKGTSEQIKTFLLDLHPQETFGGPLLTTQEQAKVNRDLQQAAGSKSGTNSRNASSEDSESNETDGEGCDRKPKPRRSRRNEVKEEERRVIKTNDDAYVVYLPDAVMKLLNLSSRKVNGVLDLTKVAYDQKLLEERLKRVYGPEELATIDSQFGFRLQALQEAIYIKCAEQLSFNCLTKHCCLVCDCDYVKSELQYCSIGSEYRNLRRVLQEDDARVAVLGLDVRLSCLFLSPSGFYFFANKLHNPVKKKRKQQRVECQWKQSPTKLDWATPGNLELCIYLKSHYYVLKNSEPALCQVPADIGSTFPFFFVGAWTPQEIAEQKTRYAAQDCVFDYSNSLSCTIKGTRKTKNTFQVMSLYRKRTFSLIDRSLVTFQ
ncbi:hypothetical protein BDR26DRAFT_924424 [Obelidium mucronatum]|nr:hypothetical protein BDR26DRAFT_924424 [Obelidium mucronatum]